MDALTINLIIASNKNARTFLESGAALTDRRAAERSFMADYLAENNYLMQGTFSSSYLYFSNFVNNKDTDFEKAMKASSDEQLNTTELTEDSKNKGNIYTRIVSATVMNSELRTTTGANGITAFSYQGVMQQFEIRRDVNGDDRKYTAIGTDKDGKTFEKEIDPYNVDPTDADFTEFAALCSYIRETENLADETMKFVSNFEVNDIFERMDYLATFSSEMGKYEMAGLGNLTLENFMPHINKLMETLMGATMEKYNLSLDETSSVLQDKEQQLIDNISKATQKVESENDYIISKHGAVDEINSEKASDDSVFIGMTTFPVSSLVSHMVEAVIPPESTSEDPVVQVRFNGDDGKYHVYNIHVNDVNPNSASDMEMFAYLSYQDHIGNKTPGAFNNWAAYQIMKFTHELETYGDYRELLGEIFFTGVKNDAEAMINQVFSWLKKNNNPSAQKQAGWCRDLLDMLNMENAGAVQEV